MRRNRTPGAVRDESLRLILAEEERTFIEARLAEARRRLWLPPIVLLVCLTAFFLLYVGAQPSAPTDPEPLLARVAFVAFGFALLAGGPFVITVVAVSLVHYIRYLGQRREHRAFLRQYALPLDGTSAPAGAQEAETGPSSKV